MALGDTCKRGSSSDRWEVSHDVQVRRSRWLVGQGGMWEINLRFVESCKAWGGDDDVVDVHLDTCLAWDSDSVHRRSSTAGLMTPKTHPEKVLEGSCPLNPGMDVI